MTASAATRPARSGRDRGPHPEQEPAEMGQDRVAKGACGPTVRGERRGCVLVIGRRGSPVLRDVGLRSPGSLLGNQRAGEGSERAGEPRIPGLRSGRWGTPKERRGAGVWVSQKAVRGEDSPRPRPRALPKSHYPTPDSTRPPTADTQLSLTFHPSPDTSQDAFLETSRSDPTPAPPPLHL